MVSTPKCPRSPHQKDLGQNPCENEAHIHVIVCSCSPSALSKELRFPGSKTYITSLSELPHLSEFLSNFIPYDSTNLNIANQQTYLQLLGRGGLQIQDLVSRSKKYIRNPLRLIGLANRARRYSRGLLNPRLWFNIFVVIVWLLVRRTLEIFGIHLPGLAVTSQNQQVQQKKSNAKAQEPIDHFKEYDFVQLGAP